MNARLIFYISASSPQAATSIVQGAINQFNRSRPGVIQSLGKGVWLQKDSAVEVPIVVSCNSESEAMSLNAELELLFAAYKRENGINTNCSRQVVEVPTATYFTKNPNDSTQPVSSYYAPQKTGCFIATACYGTQDSKDVITLRMFRDECLLSNAAGRLFVAAYYKLSPTIAGVIARNRFLRVAVRCVAIRPLALVLQHARFSRDTAPIPVHSQKSSGSSPRLAASRRRLRPR